jgi:calcineurin-like phosphoesterase
MCGTLNSSLGVEVGIAIERWKGEDVKNRIDRHPPYQLNAVLVDIDDNTGRANNIEQIIIRTHTL